MMEQTIITAVITAVVSVVTGAIVTYVSWVQRLRTDVELLKHRIEKSEQRLDRKSQVVDDLVKQMPNITVDIKQYVQQELSGLKDDFAEIKGDMKALTKMLNIFKDPKV